MESGNEVKLGPYMEVFGEPPLPGGKINQLCLCLKGVKEEFLAGSEGAKWLFLLL